MSDEPTPMAQPREQSELRINLADQLSFTVDQAAAVTGLTRRKIQGAMDRGELRYKIIGRNVVIARSNLLRLIGETNG